MLSALLFVFSGCIQSHIPEAEPSSVTDPSASVSQAPVVAVEITLAPSEPPASAVPSPTPTPVPTPEPTPEPTPTPVPTPTPDPFRPGDLAVLEDGSFVVDGLT